MRCDCSSETAAQLPATPVVKTPIETSTPAVQESVVAPAQSAPKNEEASDDVYVE